MIRFANVVQTTPGQVSLDIVMRDTNERFFGVRVMSHDGSSDTGTWGVPSVKRPDSEADATQLSPTNRNLTAVVVFDGPRPFVIGFTNPNGSMMAFNEDDRRIYRHATGGYETWAPDGSHEVFHPSGSYIRMGTGAHQDLAAISADGNWKPPAAGVADPTITVKTSKVSVTITPAGAVTLSCTSGELTLNYQHATLTGNVALMGNLAITGAVTVTETVTATGDVIGANVSVSKHLTSGVVSGGAVSGLPVPSA